MARDKFGQKDWWREELHADDLAGEREVARIQRDNAVSAGGESRGHDRPIIGPLPPGPLPPRLQSRQAPGIGVPGSHSRPARFLES